MENTIFDVLCNAEYNIISNSALEPSVKLGKEQLSNVITALKNGWTLDHKYFPEMLNVTRKDFEILKNV